MSLFHFTTFLFILLHFISFPKLSVGVDTLLANQTLVIGQTLISQNQIFELGFFSPGKSKNWFLGIWYKSTPDVCVWVANRNSPITHSQTTYLTLTENITDLQDVFLSLAGNGAPVITICKSGSIIWSANSSGVASDPVLHLLDDGNLVLLNDSSPSYYFWQSFDHPTDTWLPGMKMVDDIDAGVEKYLTSWRNSDDPSPGDYVFRIENQGLPETVIYKGTMKRYRTGKWNGLYFGGTPRFPSPVFNPLLDFENDRLVSFWEPYDSSKTVRFTLGASGVLEHYAMNAKREKWNLVSFRPQDPCELYGKCGFNGICGIDKPVRCECFKGFAPKIQYDWNSQDWSSGCARIKSLNCGSGDDGFIEVKQVKYPDMVRFWLNITMSLGECRAECLRNCNCTAYANPYITDGGRGCLMWFGELIDTRGNPEADSKQNLYIRLPASELGYSTDFEKEKEQRSPIKLILLSIASGVLVSGFINGAILFMTRRNRQAVKSNNKVLELPVFKLATIVAATNNFSTENIIGEGGFGPVYRGELSAKEEIAVKRMSRTSAQGLEEFKNEVILIAKLQHRNLVRLLGCCIEGDESMLIYEYLQNKSLDYFVFDQNQKTILTWPKRFDIINGVARGLLYLHHDSRLKIIHRDLKTSNILLDENLNPKISDFGLARIFREDQSIARTKRVVGTYGYMAPEYTIDGKYSAKSDIFSLGVVLLEIVSGKKNRAYDHCDHYYSLLGHAWLSWKENRIVELMDESLNDTFVESEVKRCIQVGLLCVQKFAEDRPVMSSVIFMLGTDGAILPEPKEPGFFTERSCITVRSCTLQSKMSHKATMSITDLEAR